MCSQHTNFSKVIAIDGPSGSGKSTIAKELANALNVLYIDTGAMFRALAYYANENNIDLKSESSLMNFLESIKLEYGLSENVLIKINGSDLTEKIREHHVSKLASVISQSRCVREFLLNFQRDLARDNVCVMEGRDIGTVVFPDSFCKFFVTASAEVRAKRRLNQLIANGDLSLTLDQVIKDVLKRDETDSNRQFAPLKKAEDAMPLDTTNLAMSDIINIMSNEVKFRTSHLGFSI